MIEIITWIKSNLFQLLLGGHGVLQTMCHSIHFVVSKAFYFE